MDDTQPPVQSLIPHSGAMCLLDGIRVWDAAGITCFASSHTRADNPLRHDNRLSAQAGIEYAAQAMAAHAALANPAGPRRGYLAVVNKVRWHVDRLDRIESPLEVRAWCVLPLPAGRCYGFALDSHGARLLEGEAIVVMPDSTEPTRQLTDNPSR